jgi:hypothetical protein
MVYGIIMIVIIMPSTQACRMLVMSPDCLDGIPWQSVMLAHLGILPFEELEARGCNFELLLLVQNKQLLDACRARRTVSTSQK